MENSFADIDFYTNIFLGNTLSSSDGDKYLRRASIKINDLTFNRASLIQKSVISDENVSAEVQDEWLLIQECCCELAEFLYSQNGSANDGFSKKSESVDGWSVSYATGIESRSYINNEVRNIIEEYLGNTGLMCRW